VHCRSLLTTLFSLLACLSATALHAQSTPDPATRRPINAVKTTTPPTIDGDLTDAAWQTAPTAALFYDRQQGTGGPDQTVVRLLYDEKYIYVSFHCRDSQPDKIVARETVRDSKYANPNSSGNTEDNVEVSFDPFLSHHEDDFAKFSVNPLGTKSAHITGGRAGKAEWKGDWDAAVKRVADGWDAEMRIPWGILSYPSGKKSVTMGINFWRWQDRTQIQSVWSNVGQQRFNELEGLWNNVEVPQGAFKPKLSLLPYVLPGFNRTQPTLRSGLDARYTITPELTTVATINPDFGTIEGAVEGIQFTRSERFVPERRPFFLEGADYFNAGEDFAIGNYFYSRHIENFDLGTKVYGKLSPKDSLGFLNTIDFHNRMDTVTRYRHDISPTQSAGFFFTNRTAKDDNNSVGFLMHNIRWGKFGIQTQAGITNGHNAGGDAEHLNFTYGDKNNFTSLLFLNVSPLFQDSNGLIFFNDYHGVYLFDSWSASWRKGFFRDFEVDFYPSMDWHSDGRMFRKGGGLDLTLTTRSDWRIGLDYLYQTFDGQIDNTFGIRLRRGVSNRFKQWGLRLFTGRQGGSPYTYIGPDFSLRVLKKLDLSYGGGVQNLDGRVQQHVITANYELSPTRSFGGRVVVQDANTNWYLSYRNSGERGMETFFIIGDPNARRFSEQVRVKFVFAL
jgi:hypothetical protein